MRKYDKEVYIVLSLLFILQIVLLFLEAIGLIHWGWFMTSIPIIVFCMIIITYGLILLIHFFIEMFSEWEEIYWKKK
jgi:membrane protein YdbS with pleckstrin-like domain